MQAKTFLVIIICLVALACNRKMYYNRVQANTSDFDFVLSYIQKNNFLDLDDSIALKNNATIHFSNKCIYQEKIQDSTVSAFMKKYDLDRICFHKDKQNF